jgi:hypothetical protein
MRLLVAVIGSLLVASPSLQAEPPPNQISVTPRNDDQFNFSVVLSARGKARSFNVFAPPRVNGNCIPSIIGTELRAKDGRVIYSQTIELESERPGPELRGQYEDSTQVLVLWITYLCPSSGGTRYAFSSEDWEKAGLRQ